MQSWSTSLSPRFSAEKRFTIKYWRVGLVVLVVVALSIKLIPISLREIHYHRALKGYSQALKPGTRRSDVEAFLKSRNIQFSQMCCSGTKLGAADDLVRVGHEKAGLICNEMSVYVAFQFAAMKPNKEWTSDSDRLVGTTLFRSACLDLT